MPEKLSRYDPAGDLTTGQAIADFVAAAFETGDASFIAHAPGIAARAKGIAQIASQTGLSRAQIYRSFRANGNPGLRATLAQALGLRLTVKPAAAHRG